MVCGALGQGKGEVRDADGPGMRLRGEHGEVDAGACGPARWEKAVCVFNKMPVLGGEAVRTGGVVLKGDWGPAVRT